MQWRAETCPSPWDPEAATYADCNGDGVINGLDFQVIYLNWGRTRSLTFSSEQSEEPLSLPPSFLRIEKSLDPQGYLTVRLSTGKVIDLNSLYAILEYDPQVLVLDESFGQNGIMPLGFLNKAEVMANGTPGRIEMVLGLKGVSASGSGEVAEIRFRIIGDPLRALSQFNLSSPTLTFLDGRQAVMGIELKQESF
jgi:hypothetical protein